MSINVNVPTKLITAQYNYTLNGMRLRTLILSKLAPEDYPNQTDMIISVDEWVNTYGGNKSGALESMLAGAESIQTSPVVFQDEPLASYLMVTSSFHTKDAIKLGVSRDFLEACIM